MKYVLLSSLSALQLLNTYDWVFGTAIACLLD